MDHTACGWTCLAALLLLQAVAAAEETRELTPAEADFAKAMSHSTLVGRFTLSSQTDQTPREERYDVGHVQKLTDRLWLLPTRIRYGDKDVNLPIALPVEFAGDTAVIRVDKLGFPGLGAYSARVLVHDDRYAGYWQGDGHGGHLFGEIKHEAAEPEATGQ